MFDGARRIGWNCGSKGSDLLATLANTSDAGAHLRQFPKSL
nr:D253 [uncultured bacterium]